MIMKGSQRGGAIALSNHLLNGKDNEHITVFEVRGFVGETLPDALTEAQAIAKGTKCQQFLFSLSLKPPEIARSPEPALAPPGMSGIRTEKRFAFRASPAPEKDFSPTQGNLKREFKSLVRNQTDKGHDIER